MEKRLQDFILSVQQLADVRNLDVYNPVVFQMEHPITALRYTIVAAKQEPSYMGVPINVTWVVLDPADPYYLKALKLKTVLDTETVTNKPKVANLDAWWHVVRTYDEIFSDPQYYVNAMGMQGPVGPTGPAGPEGTMDVDAIVKATLGVLGNLTGTLEIRGADVVPSSTESTYELWLTEPAIDEQGNMTTITRQVYAPIYIQADSGSLPANTALTAFGVLHAGSTVVDVPATLLAEYPSWTKIVTQTKPITISSRTVTGIVINGASSIYAGASSAYTVTASYSDGSSATISPTTWEVDNTAYATISGAGTLLGANPLTQNQNIVITATFNGFTAVKPVTIKQLLGTVLTINGASSVAGNSTSTYTAVLTLNSGATMTVTPTWAVSNTTDASVTAGGAVTVDNNGVTFNLTASYTLAGTSTPVTASKGITIVPVVTQVAPFYGTGPALPTDWQSFVTALPHRGTAGTLNTSVAIDCIGQSTYMYFAAPKSLGKAQFFDVMSQFFGGWGGAGNSGPGPSTTSVNASNDEPIEVSITINGTAYPFYVYRSDYANLGTAATNQWTVSAAP